MSAATLASLPRDRIDEVCELFAELRNTLHLYRFVRVLRATYATHPLGCGNGPSRFSAPDPTPPFRLLYGTENLATAAFETLIRDRFDLNPSRVLMPHDYSNHCAANISTAPGESVTLLDLTEGNAARCGVPSDVIRHSRHSSGQFFSAFIHANMPFVDGLLYHSRFTARQCVAIYDRAHAKLQAAIPVYPLTQPMLSVALQPWNIHVR